MVSLPGGEMETLTTSHRGGAEEKSSDRKREKAEAGIRNAAKNNWDCELSPILHNLKYVQS